MNFVLAARIYDDVVKRGSNGPCRLAVVHPPLNVRSASVALSMAICTAHRGYTTAVLTKDDDSVRALMREWVTPDVRRTMNFATLGGGWSRVGRGKLWIGDDYLPKVDRTFVVDAHTYATEPRSPSIVAFGEMPPRDSWLYALLNEDGVKLDLDRCLDQWPDLKPEVPPEKEREGDFNRRWLLQDVEVRYTPFRVFARRRLFVRTDKSETFLDKHQVKQAEAMLGSEWRIDGTTKIVSFRPSKVQKYVQAIKRATVRAGKKPWFLTLKYRRGGITTLEQAENYWLSVERPHSYIATLAHTDASTRRIFRIASLMRELDPRRPRLLSDSKTALEFANGSYFYIGTAGGQGFQRGDTSQKVHGSEVSRWCLGPNRMEKVRDLVSAIQGACSHGVINFETTAKGMEWFAATYKDAKVGLNNYTNIFLPWFIDPANVEPEGSYSPEEIQDTLTEEEKKLIERHSLSLGQVAFRRERKKEYGPLFAQEMPEDDESCFLISGTPWFDVERCLDLIDQIGDMKRLMEKREELITKGVSPTELIPVDSIWPLLEQPLFLKKPLRGGYLQVWRRPQKGHHYVLGADTSEGVPGGDLNGCGVIDSTTCETVAAVHGLMSISDQAEVICEMSKLYNDAPIVVERENYGHAVLKCIEAKLGDMFAPLERGGRVYFFKDGRPGWSTNGETRPNILAEIQRAMNEGWFRCWDTDLYSECCTFKLQPSGKWEHDPGCHDDAVFKWAIALYARHFRRSAPTIRYA